MNKGRNLLLIFTAGMLSLAAFGQTQQAPANNQSTSAPATSKRDPVATRVGQMSRRLNLTEEQKAQITPVLQDQLQQERAIRQNKSLTPQQRIGQLRQLRDSSRAQVEALLTPEQVAKMPRPGAPRAMARMAQRLNLTADQKSKIRPLFADQHKQVQAVQSDAALTPQQRQEKVREIRKATQQQVMAVLTPEQQQQMKQMRRWRQRNGTGNQRGKVPGPQPQSSEPPSTGQSGTDQSAR